ncbi:hypothetical protein GALL_55150 [mine drainage metagenome]|uniref:Antitoxin Xre-like helix-turn-helix domain-containing protein n=1 Tax=mine drainage metagenome TaxID=410659 RepID=A0A1J5SYV5_9ZZZZ
MAKTIKKHTAIKPPENTVQEPAALYAPSVKIIPSVTDFSFKKFQKIADKVPFTQKEWANILHLSERTLQRYSKDNSSFEGIYIDRILQIEQLINLGLETFNNATALYNWLKKEKVVFNRVLNFESLYSYQGIQDTYNQIGRILHNVYT